jgi:hypothetical protein
VNDYLDASQRYSEYLTRAARDDRVTRITG